MRAGANIWRRLIICVRAFICAAMRKRIPNRNINARLLICLNNCSPRSNLRSHGYCSLSKFIRQTISISLSNTPLRRKIFTSRMRSNSPSHLTMSPESAATRRAPAAAAKSISTVTANYNACVSSSERVGKVNLRELATKEDLRATKEELRWEIGGLRNDMEIKFAKVDGELKLLKWILGFIAAGVASLVLKAFF